MKNSLYISQLLCSNPSSHASKTFYTEAMERTTIITFKVYLREGTINKISQLLNLTFYESATYLFV